ncbi:MAG TPA: hypothetical protein VLT45_32210, partial [Kofleriaceae bacterium]|nr:hypothetical protein [Kofleriaceae bacterium]
YALANRYDDARAAMAHAEAMLLARAKDTPAANVASLVSRIQRAFMVGDGELGAALARQLLALSHEMHDANMEQEAQLSIAQAYDIEQDFPRMIDENLALLALLDKAPDGGAPDMRAAADEALGRAYNALARYPEAIEPLRKAVELYAKAGDPDGRAVAVIAMCDALVATGKAHDARELLEPLLHELHEGTDVRPQRIGSAELALARALWDDGDARDRDRAKALAADAKRDYTTAIANMQKIMPVVVPRLQAKLSAIEAWQNKHE